MLQTILYVLWISYNSVTANTSIINSILSPTTDNMMIECAIKIYQNYKHLKTALIYSVNDTTVLDPLVKTASQSGSINIFDIQTLPLEVDAKFFIHVYDDEMQIPHIFHDLDKFFLLVGKENLSFIPRFWHPGHINTIIIDQYGNINKIKSFEPIAEQIGHCNDLNMNNITNEYGIKFKNFDGRSFSTTYQINPPLTNSIIDGHSESPTGLEIALLDEAAKKYNYSLKYEPYYYILTNVFLMRSFHDIIFGGLNSNLEITKLHNIESKLHIHIVIAVPKNPEIINWAGLIKVFTLNLWVLIIATLMFYCFAMILIGKLARIPEGYNKISFCLLQTYVIFLGQSAKQPNRLLFAFSFIIFVLFSLIIINAFTGIFTALLITPSPTKQINSLSEIFDAGLTLTTFLKLQHMDQYSKMLTDNDAFIMNELLSNASQCDGRNCLEYLVKYRNTSLFTTREYLEAKENIDLLPMIHQVTITDYYTVIYADKRSSIRTPIEQTVSNLWEGGILTKWLRDLKLKEQELPSEPIKLTLIHLYLVWLILIVGLLITLIVFVGEIVLDKIQRIDEINL